MTQNRRAMLEINRIAGRLLLKFKKWLSPSLGAMEAGEGRSQSRADWFLVGASVGLFTVLAALAILFGTANGMATVAAQGTVGIYDEAALSAAAAARNQLAQAQVIAVAEQLGIATEFELEKTLRLAELATTELVSRVDRLTPQLDDPTIAAALSENASLLAATVRDIGDQIRGADLDAARTEIDTGLEQQYQTLVSLLADHRDAQLIQMGLAQQDAGRIANASRFLVAFLVPMSAMLLYKKSVGRRQERMVLEQELEHQKVIGRTKDEAIANLSHELRTPLTSIYGFAMTMLEHPIASEPELATELAKLIVSESADLSRMVDDLLTAAKANNKDLAFRKETVDPVSEVDNVVAPFAINREIHIRLAEGRITADRLRLRHILRNLVSNAIKHGSGQVAIIGRVDGPSYLLEVIDQGPGVAPDLKDRLFQRYMHEGPTPLLTGTLGLGLSIAHLLTTSMGGTIGYRRAGGLTIFEVRFPLIPDQKAEPDLQDVLLHSA